MNRIRLFFVDVFSQPRFGWFLAVSAVAYFVGVRLGQDVVYRMSLRSFPDLFASHGNLIQPEPLEAPLYLAGYLLIPLGALGLWFIASQWRRLIAVVATIGGVVMLWFVYPALWHVVGRVGEMGVMAVQYAATHDLVQVLWLATTKRIVVTGAILGISTVAFVWLFASGRRPFLAWIRQHRDALSSRWAQTLFLLAVAIVVFHPNFPFDPHHYNYFLGPVNDILHGKPILYETYALYGLLDVYALAAIFRWLLPLSYPAAVLVVTGLFAAFFAGMYFFIRRWLGSHLMAVIGVSALVATLYLFQTSPTRSSLFFPAMSPLRYGWYLPILFLIHRYGVTRSAKAWWGAIVLAAIALFWTIDAGAYVAAATLITLGIAEVLQRAPARGAVLRTAAAVAFRLGAVFVLVVGAVVATITAANAAVFGALPDWSLFTKEFLDFVGGVVMNPLPAVGVFVFLVLGYVVAWLAVADEARRGRNPDLALVFLLAYGAFQFLYYIGNSSWQTLYLVTGPFFLILLYVFYRATLADPFGPPWAERLLVASGYAVAVFAALLLVAKLPVEFAGRNYAQISESFQSYGVRELSVADEYTDGREIRRAYPNFERLAVISTRDTPLLIAAGRPNAFATYYLRDVLFKSQVRGFIAQARRDLTPVIFVGTGSRRNDQVELFLKGVRERYARAQSLRTVDMYVLRDGSF
ncbi:hypothetical protein HYZ80_03620 [Candidatus Parcubacteria bacterium]|nr:hypothetical protein [Candidatus Parcubacteria bacterium]